MEEVTTTQTSQETFTVKQAITTGWSIVKKHTGLVILLLIITMLPNIVQSVFDGILPLIPGATVATTNELTKQIEHMPVGIWAVLDIIITIGLTIIGMWLGLGYIRANLQLLDGVKPSLNILSATPWVYVLRLIGASILVTLATILGLILLIIPGIYIGVRFSLVQYYIADGYSIMDSLKASWAVTKGNVWKLIGLWLATLGVMILGVIALIVGLLRAIPTVSLAAAYVYKVLRTNTPVEFKSISTL